MRALMAGLARTGCAVVGRLQAEGWEVVAYDDGPDAGSTADSLDARLVAADQLDATVSGCDLVVVSPGLPIQHPVVSAAVDHGVRCIGDIELAAERTTVPIVAITGTNGKSTVTRLTTLILQASDIKAVEVGNMGRPFISAVTEPADVFVVEVSSQQLHATERFRPAVAAWTNFAPDHLDWHPDIDHYRRAKARIWANQGADDVAVANAEDATVMDAARTAASRLVRFGRRSGDARVSDGALVGPGGEDLGRIADLARPFPHEIDNALAAATTALSAGATSDGARAALGSFAGLPHRIELVGHIGGVPCYDDSKATTPASVVTALEAFDSVVLIAGGKNKGLDLTAITEAASHVRAVVAIGVAAPEVEAAFAGIRPVVAAATMDQAVERSLELCERGDAILLSPGCTSWDAYADYAARGDDFARAVREASVA